MYFPMTCRGGPARDSALEEAWAQIDAVSQHQQGNEKAGCAQESELLQNLEFIDGDDGV